MTRLVAAALLLTCSPSFADPVSDGLAYLLSQQSADGSFGGTTAEQKLVATVEALQTLRELGQGDTLKAHYAELFLAIAPRPPDAEVELRRELALATTGQRLPFKSLLAHAPGFETADPLHLALSLRTDLAAGLGGTPHAVQTMQALNARLQASGCWRWVENTDSVELTAEAIGALRAMTDVPTAGFPSNGPIDFALQQAAQCLRALARADGSFGSAGATATALEALLVAPGNNLNHITGARAFLVSIQAADGSIGGSVRVTAIALRGLLAGKPDWRVTTDDSNRPLLILRNPNPLAGVTALAEVDIQNRSAFPAPATTVRFGLKPLGGGAEFIGATAVVPALAPGQTAAGITGQIQTASLQGKYLVRAVVDPAGAVAEISESNNEAEQTLNVRAEADLALTSSAIGFVAVGAGQTRIDVTVRNLGIPLTQSVSLGVWRGSPSSGGTRLGSVTVSSGMATNATKVVSVQWASSTANGPTAIHAVVDEFDSLSEADETNNQAFRFFYPGAGVATDLGISAFTGGTVPAQPLANKTFTLTAEVLNLSPAVASLVPVAVFEGTVLRGRTEVASIPANGSALVSFSLITPQSTAFTIVVDPDQLLNDLNRANNSRTFNTGGHVQAPAEFVAVGILLGSVVNGLFRLTVDAANQGSEATPTFIRLVDRNDGNKVWARVPITLNALETRTISFGPFAIPAKPPVLHACLDPDDAIAESNENDNCIETVLSTDFSELGLDSDDLSFSPVGASVGEKVHLSAVVHNLRSVDSTAIVEWWLGKPAEASSTPIGETPVAVAAGGQVTAAFDWVRTDGLPLVYARIAAVVPKEGNDYNNLASRHLFLQQKVDFQVPGFAAFGDQVRVGRLTGSTAPDLVVGYQLFNASVTYAGVALFHPDASGKQQLIWRRNVAGQYLADVALADLDNDTQPEIVTLSTTTGIPAVAKITLTSLNPDGTLKWESSRPSPNNQRPATLAIGEVNGDGIPDIVYFYDEKLQVFSGDDGHSLLTVPMPTTGGGPGTTTLVVLDVDGDGQNEIAGTREGTAFLVSRTGQILWTHSNGTGFGSFNSFGVVDLDLDGYPEMVFPTFRGPLLALDARNGNVFQTGAPFLSWFTSYSAGALRQDGLPYSAVGNNDGIAHTAVFSPELTPVWDVENETRQWLVPVFETSMADLLGLGRPQVITNSPYEGPLLHDGRNGKTLLRAPDTFDGNFGTFSGHPPVVADVYGNGKSAIVLGRRHGEPTNGVLGGQALIYTSASWKKQPALWPTRALRKGQINDDLSVSTDYRWWTGHNTWNEQFDVEPARLLPDLVVRAGEVFSTPASPAAGTTAALTATLRNLGGLNASNVRVAFYDGDPQAGGALIGSAVVTGPVAPRASAVATLSWSAYPEGLHQIYAVANSDEAIEESGRENNTASGRVFVLAGSNLCDAAVDATSLVGNPAVPAAGQALMLSAKIRNLGATACPIHLLSVRDGAGGEVVGAVQVPGLAPNAEATVSISTPAISGTHLFRFIADEARVLQDGDIDNNVATLQFEVPAAIQADYFVSALTFSPTPARPGESITGTAVVTNQGAAAAVLTTLAVESSSTLLATVSVAALGAGQSQTLIFPLVAPASSGAVVARADALGLVAEFNEANNQRVVQLPIVSSGLALSGAANPPAVLPGTPVNFAVIASVTSPSALDVSLDANLRRADGSVVAVVAIARREVLDPGATPLNFAFSPASLSPGVYSLHVVAAGAGRLAAQTDVPLTILPELLALTALSVDRGSYQPGEEAVLSQRTSNLSRNAPLAGARLTIRVLTSGAVVLSSTTRELAPLPSGGFVDTVDMFAISPSLPPGTYVADSTVRDSTGLALSTASASFTIVYQAPETVQGVLAASSPFPIGPALGATLQLTNSGALALTNGVFEFSVLNAGSLAVESTATATKSIAAGASTSATVSLPTSGMPAGQKILVVRLAGRTLDRALLVAMANVDSTPPSIVVTGVAEGELANHDVAPVVTVQDQSAFTTVFTLDGVPFANGDVATTAGAHVLSLTATDASGNSALLVIHFVIDRTPPVLTLTGPADGSLGIGPVTLAFSATDPNLGAVTATLDGVAFASGGSVAADGVHIWTVTATDGAGNSVTQTRTFTLDATPPVISVSGVLPGDLLSHPVVIGFTATDAHPGIVTATLDGVSFASGTSVFAEGAHLLQVTAIDTLGNTSNRTLAFTIDLTAPVITLGGVAAGAVRNAPVTVTFSATGASAVSGTLDGAPFASGGTVSTAGDHLVLVTASDAAGNASTASVAFALDFTAPVINISGVSSGQLRNTPAAITFSAADAHLGAVTATLDSAPFSSSSVVSSAGDHLLVVTAFDAAGNAATRSVPFSIDVSAPVITITGVTNGAVRNTPVTVSYSASDVHALTVAATLDGVSFGSGSTVSGAGTHVLVVTATDGAGNNASQTLTFALDFAAPLITVTGVTSGALRNTPVVISFGVADAHPGTTSATLDGAAFVSGATVSAAGDHLLVVASIDAAGNAATKSVPFSLDFTAPVISLTGVTEGASGTSFTPVFSATDAHSVTVTATLDGAGFVSGAPASSAGAHTLMVTATDGAGNSATTTRHFTITSTQTLLPAFHFAVCAFGNLTVSNNARVTGASGATASVATNGAFTSQNNARIGGAVVAGGAVGLKNNAIIDGRVYHGGSYTQLNNAIASGGHQSVAPAPAPCECGFDLTGALAAAAATNNNGLLAGNPAFVNGALTVQNNGTLTLAGGRYYLSSLKVLNNAKLTAAAGAQVQLYVQGNVTLGNNSMVGAAVGGPGMLLVSGAGPTGTLTLSNNADAALSVYAPNAPVTLANNAKLYGAVVGRDVTLSNNQQLVLTGLTQTTPPPLSCP